MVADRKKAGRITQDEYASFHSLLQRPDAPEYLICFRLFDRDNEGVVKVDKLQKIYDEYRGKDGLAFDFKGPWASLYFGSEHNRHDMTYDQFAQMIRGLQGERIRQAFQHYDTDKDGMITPEQFANIIRDNQGHKLSDHILENLPTLCNIQNGANITYPVIRAFLNITREMDLLDLIIRNATRKSSDGRIDKRDFLEEAQRVTRFSQYTPLEAEILFHFASLDNPTGRLSIWDFTKVLDSSYRFGPRLEGFSEKAEEAAAAGTSFFHGLIKSGHHFGLGAIAGALGAFVVYPIDLVKTRMQNQRSGVIGQRLYDNSIDCARKIIRNEGFKGLYAGLPPQLVGVAPEKAIKLTVNELLRGTFKDKKTGQIGFPLEMVSGGTAGACQVVSSCRPRPVPGALLTALLPQYRVLPTNASHRSSPTPSK
jgi:solute carrier family 25 (mitochondrial aspartate/glutamate transporter), member 12/13